MSQLELTPHQREHLNDTRQPALWGCLITFLVINDLAIAGKLWGTWTSVSSRSRVLAEDVLILLSGVFVNVIIANLMVATHYGLGLHIYAVNYHDADYPSNVSRTFKHIWITMVLMSGFFTCIKMTLLFFYRRLFRVPNNSGLNIYWKANFAYVVLWFFGSTGFYLFQCWPVQWYFMQYFARFKKPVPGGMTGQCDATTVLHVSMPLIFSLISDFALLLLPLWAISKLKLNRNKKRGLMVVFGIGLVACFLELGRILALIIHTDDKDDPPYGVATFLILTAAEETTAVVCACLPVIAPMIARAFKSKAVNSDVYGGSGAQGSSGERSARGFKRVGGLNSLWTTTSATKVDSGHDDGVPLTKVEVTGNDRPGLDSGSQNEILGHARRPVRDTEHHPARVYPASRRHEPIDLESAGDIRVRTDIQVRVGTLQDGRGRFAS